MWLKELQIRNWMIIKEADLQFSKSHNVIGLVGRYANAEDSGRSNRAGKSSVIDAIKYLLDGVGRSRQHVKLINRAAQATGQGLYLRGAFVLRSGEELVIQRSRDATGKPTVEVSGVEGANWNDVNELVANRIGFTSAEYQNTCFFGQGQIHQFMDAAPRDKRKLLMEWLNQDRWDRRRVYARSQATLFQNKLAVVESTLAELPKPEFTVEHKERALKALDKALRAKSKSFKLLKRVLKRKEEELATVQELENLIERKGELTESLGVVQETKERADRLKKKIYKMEGIHKRKDKERGERAEVATRDYLLVRGKYTQLKDKYDALDGAVGVCPLLGEGCDRIGGETLVTMAEQVEELKEGMVARKKQKESTNQNNFLMSQEEDNKINGIKRKLNEVGNTDVEYFEKRIQEIYPQIDKLRKQVKEIKATEDVETELKDMRDRALRWSADVAALEERIEATQDQLKVANEYEQRQGRLKKKIRTYKRRMASWSYCVYMFSNRGIPGEYIKSAFGMLEHDINYILDRMNTGMTVEFAPYRETKKFENYCLACGYEFGVRQKKCKSCGEARQYKRVDQLVLNITDAMEGSSESEFALDSGGGQVLLSFAVRLALLFLKCRQGNVEVPPVVLDEVAGFLDPVNRQAVNDVVVNLLTQEFGVEQVWWISHNEEILGMLENALAVTRYGDHSVVDWL